MIKLLEFIKLSKFERQKHINLSEQCIERGGNSTNHRGILAQYLNSEITTGIKNDRSAILAHACNNSKCSNPRHLYWGTDYENIVEDGKKFGTHNSPWDRMINKYGLDTAKLMNKRTSEQSAKAGAGNKNKPKSEEHKRKISETLKNKKPS